MPRRARWSARRSASKLDQGRARERITLLHGALTYRDVRWHGCDAAALVEVIEHLEPERLATLAEVVFGAARPRTVVVTTPNVEHNALFETLSGWAIPPPRPPLRVDASRIRRMGGRD